MLGKVDIVGAVGGGAVLLIEDGIVFRPLELDSGDLVIISSITNPSHYTHWNAFAVF